MENLSSSLGDLSLSVRSYAIVSDLLQHLGVGVGQLASIYSFLFAAYRSGQCLHVWVYKEISCKVSFLCTRTRTNTR
jgi:hypothetical protein